jgi:protease II
VSANEILQIVVVFSGLILEVWAAEPPSSSVAKEGSPRRNLAPPPVAPVRPISEDYFGTKVVDPYRYMEDLRDPQVQAWFKAQDDYTRAVLARIPGRGQLLERIKQLDQSAPFQVRDVQKFKAERFYYQKQLATEEMRLCFRDALLPQLLRALV